MKAIIRGLFVLSTGFIFTTLFWANEARADVPPKVETLKNPDYSYRVEDRTLWITAPDSTSYQLALPCSARAIASDGERLFVACGDEGLALFSLATRSTPTLLEQRSMGGSVLGFHDHLGRIWVEIARTEALLLSTLPASDDSLSLGVAPVPPPPTIEADKAKSTAAVDPTPTSAPVMMSSGTVIEQKQGVVVIDLGSDAGLKTGSNVAFFDLQEVDFGIGTRGKEESLIAIGVVTALSADRARVALGVNEFVPNGSRARQTAKEVTSSTLFPPRVSELWELSFTLRPFLALNSKGAGTISDASAGIRFDNNLHVVALFEPLGVGLADEGNIVASAANLIAAWDTRYFEIGLGLGWSAVNNDIENSADSAMSDGGSGLDPLPEFQSVRAGLSLAQLARLGPQDGLHLTIRNTFLYFEDAFRYGGTVGEVQIPIAQRYWLRSSLGGGASGFFYGELGVRTLIFGNGLHDSIFITASAGGGTLFGKIEDKSRTCHYWDYEKDIAVESTCYDSISYGGPLVGLGIEWRY